MAHLRQSSIVESNRIESNRENKFDSLARSGTHFEKTSSSKLFPPGFQIQSVDRRARNRTRTVFNVECAATDADHTGK
uniref:Uncharacterized protein n=1 Tax=Caenorhabditis japonica TaxID=281687 RepID=A0A8R1I7V1_CAEJA